MVFDFWKKKTDNEQASLSDDMRTLKEQFGPPEMEEESVPAPLDNWRASIPSEELPPEMEAQPMEPPFTEDFDADFPQQPSFPLPTPEFEEPKTPRTLRGVKGPMFISLKKYKELRTNLDDLHVGSNELKNILKTLKDNRDHGFDLLEKATDNLLKLEKDADKINKLMRN